MRHLAVIFAFGALALAATPALAATARASGSLVVHAGPGSYYPSIDRLQKNQRVTVEQCTRHARWCLVTPLDGGPRGWVPGDYLIGSAAKNAVTPFEFSFDPLDPLDLFR